jgi:hypothetical protein
LAVPERLANRPEQGFGKVAIWPKVVKYIAGRYVGFWTGVLTGRAKREPSPQRDNGQRHSVAARQQPVEKVALRLIFATSSTFRLIIVVPGHAGRLVLGAWPAGVRWCGEEA